MLLNHKTNEKVTAIAIHGQSHEISEMFPSFYEKCKDIFIELKYKFNYLSIDSENFKDVKINVLANGKIIKTINKIKIAPGEMESIKLTVKDLEGAEKISFNLEEKWKEIWFVLCAPRAVT